jgi:hypothetical protein
MGASDRPSFSMKNKELDCPQKPEHLNEYIVHDHALASGDEGEHEMKSNVRVVAVDTRVVSRGLDFKSVWHSDWLALLTSHCCAVFRTLLRPHR